MQLLLIITNAISLIFCSLTKPGYSSVRSSNVVWSMYIKVLCLL